MTETEISRMIVRIQGDASSLNASLSQSQRGVDRAARHIEQGAQRIERSVSQSLQSIGGKMRGFGSKLSLMITAPIAVLGGLATREFSQFEETLSRMEGLVGLSGDAVAGFKDQILQLGPAVGKSPKELAEAMFFITSAGFRGQEAFETLEITAKAAAAGMGEVKSVADAVTSAVNSYGQANLSATRATEILTGAVRAGKADASSFAPVLGQILPTANELGISFEQVGGTLAFLTKSTGSASMAATGLRGIMTQLIRPTEAARKELPWLTTAYIKQQIATKGLLPTLTDLRAKLEGAGLEVSKLWSDVEGMNAVLQLTGPNAQDAANVIDDVTNSVGIVDEAFQAWEKTMGASFAKQMARTKGLLIELGGMLAPMMGQMLDFGEMAIGVWNKITPEMKQVAAKVAMVAAAVGPMIVGFGVFVASVGAMLPMITGLGSGLLFIATIPLRLLGKAFIGMSSVAIPAVTRTIDVVSRIGAGVIGTAKLVTRGGVMMVKSFIKIAVRARLTAARIRSAFSQGITGAIRIGFRLLERAAIRTFENIKAMAIRTGRSIGVGLSSGFSRIGGAFSAIAGVGAVAGAMGIGGPFASILMSVPLVLMALSAVASAVAAIFSPIVLVSAAIAGIGYMVLKQTGVWDEFVNGVKSGGSDIAAGFEKYKTTAITSFEGVRAAIQNGDWKGAAEIAILGIKVAWFQGIADINDKWGGWLDSMTNKMKEWSKAFATGWLNTQEWVSKQMVKMMMPDDERDLMAERRANLERTIKQFQTGLASGVAFEVGAAGERKIGVDEFASAEAELAKLQEKARDPLLGGYAGRWEGADDAAAEIESQFDTARDSADAAIDSVADGFTAGLRGAADEAVRLQEELRNATVAQGVLANASAGELAGLAMAAGGMLGFGIGGGMAAGDTAKLEDDIEKLTDDIKPDDIKVGVALDDRAATEFGSGEAMRRIQEFRDRMSTPVVAGVASTVINPFDVAATSTATMPTASSTGFDFSQVSAPDIPNVDEVRAQLDEMLGRTSTTVPDVPVSDIPNVDQVRAQLDEMLGRTSTNDSAPIALDMQPPQVQKNTDPDALAEMKRQTELLDVIAGRPTFELAPAEL